MNLKLNSKAGATIWIRMGLAVCEKSKTRRLRYSKSRQSINARCGCGGTQILGMDVWEHAYTHIIKTEDLIILRLSLM
jgi:superoxide dismutase